MPSFDITCEFEKHEVNNAIDQANREVGTRFDFKDSDALFTFNKETISLSAQTEFHLQQMYDVLCNKLTKRGVDIGHVEVKDPVIQFKSAKQEILLKQGIPGDIAKKIVQFIKDKKLKVQASIQGEQVRVVGKKRDDLQEAIAALRKEDFKLPIEFGNFRE